MNHRHLLHAGCLLAASLVFSGCMANKQVTTSHQSKVKTTKTAAAKHAPAKKRAAKASKPAPVAKTSKPKPTVAQLASAAPAGDSLLEHYNVKLSTNKNSLKAGEPVSLRIMVEAPKYPLSGKEAHGFQVSLKGAGFTADQPAPECLRVHPSGSEVIYILHSVTPGTFDVTADVSVFPTRDCETFNVQKTSKPIKISVAGE
jgi:pyruvate/2-oxoglutarate dehydrogenase complex dihydrolipoamide acyltransferase (E2) component